MKWCINCYMVWWCVDDTGWPYWCQMNGQPVSPDFIFFSLTSSFVKTPCEHEHQTRTKNAFFCSPDKWSKATTVNSTQEWIKAVWICNPHCERSTHCYTWDLWTSSNVLFNIFCFWLNLCIAALILFSHWMKNWKLHATVNELSLKDTLCPCDI